MRYLAVFAGMLAFSSGLMCLLVGDVSLKWLAIGAFPAVMVTVRIIASDEIDH